MKQTKKIYYDTYYFLIIFLGFGLSCLIIYILQLIFHSPDWVLWGTFGIMIFVGTVVLTRLMPVLLIIEGKEVVFIGIPWVYRFNRDMLDEVVAEFGGILFKPRKEYEKKFKWVPKYPSEPYLGYKGINFLNYKAVGALFDVMKPITGEHIVWDKLNPKWRKYLEEKLYGSGNE